jgi:hypothetical protein
VEGAPRAGAGLVLSINVAPPTRTRSVRRTGCSLPRTGGHTVSTWRSSNPRPLGCSWPRRSSTTARPLIGCPPADTGTAPPRDALAGREPRRALAPTVRATLGAQPRGARRDDAPLLRPPHRLPQATNRTTVAMSSAIPATINSRLAQATTDGFQPILRAARWVMKVSRSHHRMSRSSITALT